MAPVLGPYLGPNNTEIPTCSQAPSAQGRQDEASTDHTDDQNRLRSIWTVHNVAHNGVDLARVISYRFHGQ